VAEAGLIRSGHDERGRIGVMGFVGSHYKKMGWNRVIPKGKMNF
jgi:hypothetical protein